MPQLKGSRTEKNLMKAFAGESQARNRYTYFASQAKKEGLVQISHIFEETANQEKEHAKRMFKFLEGGMVEFTAEFPAGIISNTLENLLEAAGGENYEHSVLYPEIARVAREEGFEDIAKTFDAISVAERFHEKRYRELVGFIENGKVFERDGVVIWKCLNCGYLHEAARAPDECPACKHPQSYFAQLGMKY